MPANTAEIKASISNPAKILHAYMRCSGITDAKQLAADLDIPIRTIQRLKLECAVADGSASCAISGTSDAPKTPDMAPPITPNAPYLAFSEPEPSRAHATKELPTEVLISKVEEINILSESKNSDDMQPKAKRRFSYTYDFEQFWSAYPVVGNSSKREAFKEWRALTSTERHLAQDGLQHLAAHCRKNPTYTCLHACRYLKQRRWESYPSAAQRLGVVVQMPTRKPSQADLEAIVMADMAAAHG